MKLLIFAWGPGETSQAYALAKTFHDQGHQIYFLNKQSINNSFFNGMKIPFNLESLNSPVGDTNFQPLVAKVHHIKPDAVILCNSKTFGKTDFIERSPWPEIPTFTVDSNWLFDLAASEYRFVRWAKKNFINLPTNVFNLGLKQNGGYFQVSKELMPKIEVVGLIPSYKKPEQKQRLDCRQKYQIDPSEKLIFCYFSGWGAGGKQWVLDNLVSAVKNLSSVKNKIKVLAVGDMSNQVNDSQDWLQIIPKEQLNLETFYLLLASSDLVFQHQGLGTMAQAISAQIPIIANVDIYPDNYYPKIHVGEVEPFEKVGLCRMLYKDSRSDLILKTIEELLYNQSVRKKMQQSQQKNRDGGEEKVVTSIVKYLSEK